MFEAAELGRKIEKADYKKQALALRGKTPQEASLAEMDELWDEAKAAEKAAFGRD